MDNGNVSAIISATAGICGVLLGNSFVAVKEWLTVRAKRRKDVEYLAIIVVSHLDRLANGCLHVSLDDGTNERGEGAGGNGEHVTTVQSPEFRPLEIDVEWRVLPRDLMYAILQIPDRQEQIRRRLAGIEEFESDPPEHIEYFWARRREYAELGLRASDLARRLRLLGKMPYKAPKPNDWHRDSEMADVIKKIDEKRAAHERRMLQSLSHMPRAHTPTPD